MEKLVLAVTAAAVLGMTGCAHKKRQSTTMSVQIPTISAQTCKSENGLPDPICTPGVVRTTNIDTICHSGSTRRYRPTSSYTNALKRQQIIAYGYADTDPGHYEEDHLISLELGGDGKDPKNLWPEPHDGQNNSFDKDKIENWLHKQICSGAMTPEDAQTGIATDWRQYLPQVSVLQRNEIQ